MDNVTIRLIDAARIAQGGVSDYRIAKVLGVAQGTISSYRTGRTQMSDEIACRVAALLGEKPAAVLAALAAERAQSDDVRRTWQAAVKRLGGIAAGIVAAVGLAGAPSPAPAQGTQSPPSVLCKLRRTKQRRGPGGGGAFARAALQLLGLRRPLAL